MTSPRDIKNLLYEQVARIGKASASPKRLELIDALVSRGKTGGEAVAAGRARRQERERTPEGAPGRPTRPSRKDGKYVHYALADRDRRPDLLGRDCARWPRAGCSSCSTSSASSSPIRGSLAPARSPRPSSGRATRRRGRRDRRPPRRRVRSRPPAVRALDAGGGAEKTAEPSYRATRTSSPTAAARSA